MRFINEFLIPFHSYITVGLKNEAESQTEISAAFSANYHESILGIHPNLSIDYSKFIFSKGNLPMAKDMAATLVDDTIQFTWDSLKEQKAKFDDQLIILLYVRELHRVDGFIGGINRSAKECVFKFNETFKGKAIDVYASMTSLDRKRIANNAYLGRFG